MTAAQADTATRRAAIAAKLATIAARERRLIDAITDGDRAADAIRGRLREELARRDGLAAELAALAAAAPIDVAALVADVERRAVDLRGLLRRHRPRPGKYCAWCSARAGSSARPSTTTAGAAST
jgi:hypothetical protein